MRAESFNKIITFGHNIQQHSITFRANFGNSEFTKFVILQHKITNNLMVSPNQINKFGTWAWQDMVWRGRCRSQDWSMTVRGKYIVAVQWGEAGRVLFRHSGIELYVIAACDMGHGNS